MTGATGTTGTTGATGSTGATGATGNTWVPVVCAGTNDNAALTAADALGGTIQIALNTICTIIANLTLNSPVAIPRGSYFSVGSTGATGVLTINQPPIANPTQIFLIGPSGATGATGTPVVFGAKVITDYIEWFGGVADSTSGGTGGTNNTPPLQWAYNALNAGTVQLLNGFYLLNNGATGATGITMGSTSKYIAGSTVNPIGAGGTVVNINFASGDVFAVSVPSGNCAGGIYQGGMKNLGINSVVTRTANSSINNTNGCWMAFTDLAINDPFHGIIQNNAANNRYSDIQIYYTKSSGSARYGMELLGTSQGTQIQNVNVGSSLSSGNLIRGLYLAGVNGSDFWPQNFQTNNLDYGVWDAAGCYAYTADRHGLVFVIQAFTVGYTIAQGSGGAICTFAAQTEIASSYIDGQASSFIGITSARSYVNIHDSEIVNPNAIGGTGIVFTGSGIGQKVHDNYITNFSVGIDASAAGSTKGAQIHDNTITNATSALSATSQMNLGPVAQSVISGTYTSGATITGTTAQTCIVTFTNGTGTGGGTATVALTGTNALAGGTALVITQAAGSVYGGSYTTAPTAATLTSGTATCSGTVVIATVLSKGNQNIEDANTFIGFATAAKTYSGSGWLTNFDNIDPTNMTHTVVPSGTNQYGSPVSFAASTGTLASVLSGAFGVQKSNGSASAVDNMQVSVLGFTCGTAPLISMMECGSDPTCATPTTISSVSLTGAGQFSGTMASGTAVNIAAGDYTGFTFTGGVCTVLNVNATAMGHLGFAQ